MPSLAIVLRPGARTPTLLAWLRRMLPAATLLVSSVTPLDVQADQVVTLEEVDPDAGPLAVADAIHRLL